MALIDQVRRTLTAVYHGKVVYIEDFGLSIHCFALCDLREPAKFPMVDTYSHAINGFPEEKLFTHGINDCDRNSQTTLPHLVNETLKPALLEEPSWSGYIVELLTLCSWLVAFRIHCINSLEYRSIFQTHPFHISKCKQQFNRVMHGKLTKRIRHGTVTL